MPRKEDSGAPGPQIIGCTVFSDRTRVQNVSPVPPRSDFDIQVLVEDSQKLRRDVLQTELRGRANDEADRHMPWKSGEMRPSPESGYAPEPLVVDHAGPSKGKYRSGNVLDDALDDTPNGSKDASDRFPNAPDSLASAADASNVASYGSKDNLNGLTSASDSSNNAGNGSSAISDGLHGPGTAWFVVSLAHIGVDFDESVTARGYPSSLSEDTNTSTTSLSAPRFL